MAPSTLCRVSGRILPVLLITLDTVLMETSAALATSLIVTRLPISLLRISCRGTTIAYPPMISPYLKPKVTEGHTDIADAGMPS